MIGPRNPSALEDQRDWPRAPHWSRAIDWRAGRWDPMTNAPRGSGLEVRGRDKDGGILEPMHWASDLSGEEQPAFQGWFVPCPGGGYSQVHPVEWQPLRATP